MPNWCILKFSGYKDEADLFGFKILNLSVFLFLFFFFFFSFSFFFFFFLGGGGGVRKYENLFW